MKITVNGSDMMIDRQCITVEELYLECGLDLSAASSIIVSHNESVIKSDLWSKSQVRSGDSVEFLRLMAGG